MGKCQQRKNQLQSSMYWHNVIVFLENINIYQIDQFQKNMSLTLDSLSPGG